MRFILLLLVVACVWAQAPTCVPENFQVILGGAEQGGTYQASVSSGCNQVSSIIGGPATGYAFGGGLCENVDEGTSPSLNTPSSGEQQTVAITGQYPFEVCPWVPAVTLGPPLVDPAPPVNVTTPYGFKWPLPFPVQDDYVGGVTVFNVASRPGFTLGFTVELYNATSGSNDVLAAHILNFDPTNVGLGSCPAEFAGAPVTNVTSGIPSTPAEFAIAPIQDAAAQIELHYAFPPGTQMPNLTLRAITCLANGEWNVLDLGVTPPTGIFAEFLWLVASVDNFFGTAGASQECDATCEPGTQFCNRNGMCVAIGNISTDTCGDTLTDNCGVGLCNSTTQMCFFEPFDCADTTPPPPQCHEYVPCNASVGGTCGYTPVANGTPCIDSADPCGTSPQCIDGTCLSTPINCTALNGTAPPCFTEFELNDACMCVNEELPGLNDLCGVGACQANPSSALCAASPMCIGTGICSSTGHVVCDATGPQPEICGDGIDQDCDGADLPCGSCTMDSDCTVPGHGCITGVCNVTTGDCSYSLAPMGMICTPEHFCSDGAMGTCAANGSCIGTPPDCSLPADPCAVGFCNPVTDMCETLTSVFDGRDCSTFCDVGATCTAGVCGGGTPRVCPSSECEDVICNATTEACENVGTVVDGQPCVGGSMTTCMVDHECAGGQCVAFNVTCPPLMVVMPTKSFSSLYSSSLPMMPMMPMMGGGGD